MCTSRPFRVTIPLLKPGCPAATRAGSWPIGPLLAGPVGTLRTASDVGITCHLLLLNGPYLRVWPSESPWFPYPTPTTSNAPGCPEDSLLHSLAALPAVPGFHDSTRSAGWPVSPHPTPDPTGGRDPAAACRSPRSNGPYSTYGTRDSPEP